MLEECGTEHLAEVAVDDRKAREAPRGQLTHRPHEQRHSADVEEGFGTRVGERSEALPASRGEEDDAEAHASDAIRASSCRRIANR